MQTYSSMANSPAARAQSNASKAYQNSSYHGISDRETMAEAFRVIISNLYAAKDAYMQRRVDAMCDLNVKTLKIITLLASGIESSNALADKEAGASALFMANLYNDMFIRITNVLLAPSPEKEFDALVEVLRPVFRSWQPAAAPAEANMMQPTSSRI